MGSTIFFDWRYWRLATLKSRALSLRTWLDFAELGFY